MYSVIHSATSMLTFLTHILMCANLTGMYIATVHYPLSCATMDFPLSHSVAACWLYHQDHITLAGCNQTIIGISF